MPIRMRLSALILCACAPLRAQTTQTTIIPQIADGDGWQTTLVLTNTGTSPAALSMSFFQNAGNSLTTAWTPVFLETATPQSVTLAAASTTFLHTPGTAAALAEGWAELQANTSVVAYAIFTQTVPGRQNQDGTAPAAAASGRILVPFDNTNNFVTTMAIANPGASGETVSVSVQPATGAAASLTPVTLPAGGYMPFTLPAQFPSIATSSGLLEFYSASGTFSIIAIRFNPTGGFTASPVYLETGGPVIGGLNAYNGTYTGNYTSSLASGAISATVSDGIVTVSNPGSGTGTVNLSGAVTFGVDLSGGATCSFTGNIVVFGTLLTANGSGTFSCTNPTFSGTWTVTRQSE